MSSNDTDTPRDPAPLRAEAARDAVAAALERYVERLTAITSASRTGMDADLRTAARLMARNTRRQLAANLTLARRLMEARSLQAVLDLQRDFLRRQAEWAMRDWERIGAQTLDLMEEGRRAARGIPDGVGPAEPALTEPAPETACTPDPIPPAAAPGRGPARTGARLTRDRHRNPIQSPDATGPAAMRRSLGPGSTETHTSRTRP